jgi:hypothetical protein
MEDKVQDLRPGFMMGEYLVTFPPFGDIVVENEDGTMSILIDVFKVDGNERTEVSQAEITPELEAKISAYINEALIQAIEKDKENE